MNLKNNLNYPFEVKSHKKQQQQQEFVKCFLHMPQSAEEMWQRRKRKKKKRIITHFRQNFQTNEISDYS